MIVYVIFCLGLRVDLFGFVIEKMSFFDVYVINILYFCFLWFVFVSIRLYVYELVMDVMVFLNLEGIFFVI